jgi:predicted nucleotidyltransferase
MNTMHLSVVPEMGMIVPDMGKQIIAFAPPLAAASLADVLFTPVQQRVLGLLYGQPARRFQSGELIRLAGSGTGAVHRLLTRMAETGLITTERVGNQKYYQANAASPVFAELVGLVRKSVGLALPLQEALAPFAEQITAAFVYGSVARGEERASSDIDLMVIAKGLDYAALYEALQSAEKQLARTISPTLMTPAEWKRKRGQADSFAARISSLPRLFLIGSEDVLG